jgi:ankyrin repeat protein
MPSILFVECGAWRDSASRECDGWPCLGYVTLDHGALVTVANTTRRTPLLTAAPCGSSEIAKLFLKRGADFSVTLLSMPSNAVYWLRLRIYSSAVPKRQQPENLALRRFKLQRLLVSVQWSSSFSTRHQCFALEQVRTISAPLRNELLKNGDVELLLVSHTVDKPSRFANRERRSRSSSFPKGDRRTRLPGKEK